MESARQRRERLRYMREAHYRKNNMIRAEKSMRAMNNRWMEDKKRESKAFVMRKNSMDDVMAQQVYRGLLRQLRSWRLEEQSELLEKMSKVIFPSYFLCYAYVNCELHLKKYYSLYMLLLYALN